jgi:hypothetical protein
MRVVCPFILLFPGVPERGTKDCGHISSMDESIDFARTKSVSVILGRL